MYFKINVENVKQNMETNYNLYLTLKNKNNEIYRNILFSKENWNDKNTENFVNNVKKNSISIDDYLIAIDNYNTYLENYLSNLTTICKTYNNIGKLNTIVFDDSNLDNIYAYLDRAVSLLNNIISTGNNMDELDVESIYDPMATVRKATNIKNQILSLKGDLNRFIKDITSTSEEFKNHVKDINLDLQLTKMKATIKTISIAPLKLNIDNNLDNIYVSNNTSGTTSNNYEFESINILTPDELKSKEEDENK